jgi:poly-gamma-glutamate capsule biosynthesis protein CapA/YwtB (metallophosphatase superfamily)
MFGDHVDWSVMKLALAGDTMLGRGVAQVLMSQGPKKLVAEEVVAACSEADLTIVNLECCISTRGAPWPDPRKPFFFRAPPVATEVLNLLGVDCVSLANNHALDFGIEALLDTFEHLDAAGIKWVGAGTDIERARRPVELEAAGLRLGVRAVTDHPAEFAAGPAHPGVAFANLREATPDWLCEAVRDADATVVSAHWGPNMITTPMPHVRRAGRDLRRGGIALVAGHSAHVFHGVEDRILYDLGDFIDDYAVDPELRNNLGLLFVITFEPQPRRLEAIPLALDYGHTRLASGDEARWVAKRFHAACAEFGTEVAEIDGRLVIDWQ